MTVLKIIAVCVLYDFVITPLGRAFVKVTLKNSPKARRAFKWFVDWAIKNGHYERK